jgi:hypothetical protein
LAPLAAPACRSIDRALGWLPPLAHPLLDRWPWPACTSSQSVASMAAAADCGPSCLPDVCSAVKLIHHRNIYRGFKVHYALLVFFSLDFLSQTKK